MYRNDVSLRFPCFDGLLSAKHLYTLCYCLHFYTKHWHKAFTVLHCDTGVP